MTSDCFDSPAPAKGARACSFIRATHPYRFGRVFSLGDNRQFAYVYRRGKSYRGRFMSLIYLRARALKAGFSISSKVGNSVVRHRLKRRMSEDFRLLRPALPPGKYVFVARPSAKDAPVRAMGEEMLRLLRQANLMDS